MSLPHSTSLPILIVGGGLSGLSLARTLHTKGIPFLLFEATSETHSQGYGITLRSWGFQPLLSLTGSSTEHLGRSTATDAGIGGIGYIETLLQDVYTGVNLVSMGGESVELFRANRALLRKWLVEGVDRNSINFGTKVVGFETAEGGVDVLLESGMRVKGCILVAADGVHSFVRKQLLPTITPTFLPATVINGQVSLSRSEYETLLKLHMRSSNVLAAVGESIAFGIHNVRVHADGADIAWTYSHSGTTFDSEDSTTDRLEPSTPPHPRVLSPEEMRAALDALRPQIAKPYASVLDPAVLERTTLYHWAMRSVRVPLPAFLSTLQSEKVAFIGDAAHAMPIFLGEGGNHGILDGVELGVKIAEWLGKVVKQGEESDDSLMEAVKEFYDGAHDRWMKGIDGSEKRLGGLHMPIEKWRMVAEAQS